MTDPKNPKKQSRSRYAGDPPRQRAPARPAGRRPCSVDPSKARRSRPVQPDGRDLYSHSRRPQEDPMVDISPRSSQARRARRAQDVRYYDGFDPGDAAPPPRRGRRPSPGDGYSGRAHSGQPRRKKKRHIGRNILCVLLVLLILVGGWMTMLFTKMDRTHNADRTQYVQQPEHAPSWEVKSNPLVTNILLLGMDRSEGGAQRSDSILLLSIDRIHMKLKMTSFLRDTYVEIPGHGRQKLNAAFAFGGPTLTMQTLENNFRIKIDKYLAVDFASFASIIDAVGGIDVTLDQALCDEFSKGIGQNMQPGKHNLKGVVALYYTRIRNVGNDYGRTQRQREVIGQLVKKMAGMGPFKLNSALNEIMPKMWTNIPALEMTAITLTSLPCVFFAQQSQQIPAEGTFDSQTIEGVGATLVPDLETNDKTLREFIYGGNAA